MFTRHLTLRTYAARTMILCALLFSLSAESYAQCDASPMIKRTIPTGSIPGNDILPYIGVHDFITGELRLMPSDYAINPTKKYPVIIYFHGGSGGGDGSLNDLCKVITDANPQLPWNIVNGQYPGAVTHEGTSYEFIILCPQYRGYGHEYSPGNYLFFFDRQVDAYLTWAMSQYRIDPDRVYLTGISSGANVVMDYVSSSVAHAERVAAAAMSSLCYAVFRKPAGPANIAAAKLPTWFIQCETDNAGGGQCVIATPQTWVSQISAQSGAVIPKSTWLVPTSSGGYPAGSMMYCKGWTHDSWEGLYTPTLGPLTFDTNIFQWSLQYSRAQALPVSMKDFSLKDVNGSVQLKWTTTSEQDNLEFSIERAGADQHFQKIGIVPGKGTTSLEQTYTFTDGQPLENINYYRLVQKDINGKEKVLAPKRIMMRKDGKSLVAVSSNPFKNELSAFVTVQQAQPVTLTITDMNGKLWATVNGRYTAGSTEVNLPVSTLPKGVYLLKARGASLSTVVKVIKQ